MKEGRGRSKEFEAPTHLIEISKKSHAYKYSVSGRIMLVKL